MASRPRLKNHMYRYYYFHLNGLLVVWLIPLPLTCAAYYCPPSSPRRLQRVPRCTASPLSAHGKVSEEDRPRRLTPCFSAPVASRTPRPLRLTLPPSVLFRSISSRRCARPGPRSLPPHSMSTRRMEASLFNSGLRRAPPTPNGGGTESKTRPQTRLYSFPPLISLHVV
jgi:hypothetical protein